MRVGSQPNLQSSYHDARLPTHSVRATRHPIDRQSEIDQGWTVLQRRPTVAVLVFGAIRSPHQLRVRIYACGAGPAGEARGLRTGARPISLIRAIALRHERHSR